MVEIIPVEDKLRQQAYCLQFGISFDFSLMSYVAFKDEEAIAICQFIFVDSVCKIYNLDFTDKIRNSSIPFLLLRTVMHFADSCGIYRIEILADNVVDKIVTSAGFERNRHGIYEADLQCLCQ